MLSGGICCQPGCSLPTSDYVTGRDGAWFWYCAEHLVAARRDAAETKERARSDARARKRARDLQSELFTDNPITSK